jgi:N-methylhydantoinase A
VVKDYSRTVLWRVSGKIPAQQLSREFAALEKKAAKDFRQESWQGSAHFHRSVDVRYRGQGYELNIPFTKNLLRDFQQEHHRRYGYTHPNREVELVTLRLRATMRSSTTQASKLVHVAKMDHLANMNRVGRGALARPARAKFGRLSSPSAPVLFDGKKLEARIYSRDELRPGKKYSGPAIITEYSATTVIPARKSFHLDGACNLTVNIR